MPFIGGGDTGKGAVPIDAARVNNTPRTSSFPCHLLT